MFVKMTAICVLVASMAGLVAGGFDFSAAETVAAKTKTVKIILVGDSTVTDNPGWGLSFKQFLTDGAECINTSQGGRISEISAVKAAGRIIGVAR